MEYYFFNEYLLANIICAIGQIMFGFIIDRDASSSSLETVELTYWSSSLQLAMLIISLTTTLIIPINKLLKNSNTSK